MDTNVFQKRPFLLGLHFLLLTTLFFQVHHKQTNPLLLKHPTMTAQARVNTGLPVRLRIPSLKIDAPIMGVGLTRTGDMDVPRSGSQVGWYALGARPGEAGNAVIAGHLDTALGTPAVFWNLNDLSEKDDVFVLDDFGHEYHFQVVKSVVYNAREAPLQQIFGASIAKNLQLITCNGAWQADEKSYDKRLVVYTNLVQD